MSRPRPVHRTEPPRTRQEMRERSRERLLDAAESMLATRGYRDTTFARLGEAAGYSRGLVTQRFGSKAGLIRAVLERLRARFVLQDPGEHGEDSEDSEDGPDTRTAVTRLFDAALDELHDDNRSTVYYALMGEALAGEPGLKALFREADAGARAALTGLLRRGLARGDLDPALDPESASVLLLATLRGLFLQYLLDPDGLDLVRLRRHVHAFIAGSLPGGPG